MSRPASRRHADRRTRARATAPVRSRAEWRALIALAAACAEDAAERRDGAAARIQLEKLNLVLRGVDTGVFEREAGLAASQAAAAFVTFARAFARVDTPSQTRAALGPTVACAARYLEDVLHALAERDFERAHANRPEVYG